MSFLATLRGLVDVDPDRVCGAVFCDDEGERIEALSSGCDVDLYTLDLAAASFASLAPQLPLDDDALLRVTYGAHMAWVQRVPDRYLLVLLAQRSARGGALEPRVREAGRALASLL